MAVLQIATVIRSLNQDPHCGDQCSFWKNDNLTTLCVVDGLGHGRGAEIAALAAIDYVARHYMEPVKNIFVGCNAAIKSTRGVAMGIAVVDEKEESLTFGGIGNIELIVTREKIRHYSSNAGIVGAGYRKLLLEKIPFKNGNLALMYTDGLKMLIDLSRYKDLIGIDLQNLAERIVRDWGKTHDDRGLLICRRLATGDSINE